MKHEDKKLVAAVDYLVKVLEECTDFEDYLNRLEFVAKKLTQNQKKHKSRYDDHYLERLTTFLDDVTVCDKKLN